ncbi:MAG TPA: MCP four helix bundle domain-containing protein, partial [Steroidobacteraceae bacterium]
MFADTKVATRLAVAFGVVLALLIGVVGVSLSRLALVNEGMRVVTEEDDAEMLHATRMRAAAFEVSVRLRNLILYSDDASLRSEYEVLEAARERFGVEARTLEKMFASIAATPQAEKDLLSESRKQWETMQADIDRCADFARANKNKEAFAVLATSYRKQEAELLASVLRLRDFG